MSLKCFVFIPYTGMNSNIHSTYCLQPLQTAQTQVEVYDAQCEDGWSIQGLQLSSLQVALNFFQQLRVTVPSFPPPWHISTPKLYGRLALSYKCLFQATMIFLHSNKLQLAYEAKYVKQHRNDGQIFSIKNETQNAAVLSCTELP